jgi:hypothetical protein
MTKQIVAFACLAASTVALAAGAQPSTTPAVPTPVVQPSVPAPPQPPAARAAQPEDRMPLLKLLAAGNQTNSAHAEGALVAVAGFAFTLLIVMLLMAFRRAQEHERYETIRRLIEKGAEIPKELLGVVAKEGSDLRRGVIFISLGVGFVVFFTMGSGSGVGALFVCLGLGYLLAWKMEPKKAG